MKKSIYQIIRSFIIISLIVPLYSSSAICSNLTIYTEESPKAHFKDADGKITGYVYEFVLAMQKKMGDKTPIQMVSWEQGYNLASTKPNVVLFSTTFTEERRPLFKWVGPVSESVWVLYAKAGAGIKIKSLESAKSLKKIGTYKDDVREQFLKEKGFKNLESVTDDSLNLKKLMDNSIDVWVSSRDRAPFAVKEMGIPMESIEPVLKMVEKGLFIVFNAQTPDDIVDKWLDAYDALRSDGTMESIYKKWNVAVPQYQIPAVEIIED